MQISSEFYIAQKRGLMRSKTKCSLLQNSRDRIGSEDLILFKWYKIALYLGTISSTEIVENILY